MPTYQKANAALERAVEDVMKRYHGPLRDAGVTVDLLVAYGTQDESGLVRSPAIKVHGVEAKAVVRILSLKDRAAGRSDAEIVIDGDHLDEWADEELAAVIDHELTHLELCTVASGQQAGAIRRDDLGRPRLKMRPHDRDVGWFDCVARRHAHYSTEVEQAFHMWDDWEFRQLYLPGIGVEHEEESSA